MVYVSIFLVFIILGLLLHSYKLSKQSQSIIEINQERQRVNQQIEQEIIIKTKELSNLASSVEGQNNILKSLIASSEEMRASASKQAEEFYEARKQHLTEQLQSYFIEQDKAIKLEIDQQKATLSKDLQSLQAQVTEKQNKLNELQAKQDSYLQARLRQEQIDSNKDYFRLALDDIDINDISLLRELQARFSKKESIDKLIWEVYYKPAYDILMSHLFNSTNKVCGIYQIVDLTTGQGYIGQSVDIRERFRQHIKSALTYGKQTNKLYQAMQKSGVHNFTFEILEEVSRDQLNTREAYWIEFYKTKEYGMNSTKGNS